MPETFGQSFYEEGAPRRIDCSLVIPVYNEEESLRPLLSEILQVMAALHRTYEIIFVDDGSSDETPKILGEFKRQLPEAVCVVTLPRRSGQTAALREGLAAARGETVVTMDADLQNDPADIPSMISKLNEGFDCVCGWRKARQDTPLKAGLSKLGNLLQRRITRGAVHDVSCTLRVYKNSCAARIPLDWEGQHRFIPLNLSLQGYKIGEVTTHHRARQFGRSKYSHNRIFGVVRDFFRTLTAGSGGRQ